MYTYIYIYTHITYYILHGSSLIRRQRGHPGVVLPPFISDSANHEEGMQLELSPIRNEPNLKRAQLEMSPIDWK